MNQAPRLLEAVLLPVYAATQATAVGSINHVVLLCCCCVAGNLQTGRMHESTSGVDPTLYSRALMDVDMTNHADPDWCVRTQPWAQTLTIP